MIKMYLWNLNAVFAHQRYLHIIIISYHKKKKKKTVTYVCMYVCILCKTVVHTKIAVYGIQLKKHCFSIVRKYHNRYYYLCIHNCTDILLYQSLKCPCGTFLQEMQMPAYKIIHSDVRFHLNSSKWICLFCNQRSRGLNSQHTKLKIL